MAKTIEDIENEIRELSADDRRHLLRDLIADLDGDMDQGAEEAWLVEVEQRYKEIKEGSAELILAEEVFARVRARLKI
jgi:putative addiction module component (TIGR02574 family)